MKKSAVTLLLTLVLSLYANAALSEIRKEFPQQKTALSATAILLPPASTASYLLCVYLSQPGSANSLSAIVRWTDENARSQTFTFSAAQGVISNCNPIRNLANTSPTVETSGAFHGTYDLFVVGFGFWTTGSQGQGGITEPFVNWHITAGPTNLLSLAGAVTYLVAADCEGGAGTLSWVDEIGSQSITISASRNGALIPVHVAASANLVFNSGSCYLSAVNMGKPKSGAGPLTDYEVNLLKYTDVKWPNTVPVVSNGPLTTYAFAGNIAQAPNTSGAVLEMYGDDLFLQILYADKSGSPGNNDGTILTFPIGIVGAGYRGGNPFTFNITTAINSGSAHRWGASPEYSAEVDVIQF